MHPLYAVLAAAADGRFPPTDGRVEVMRPADRGSHAVVEFTAHAVVVTDRDESDVIARGADGLGGSTAPDLLRWLAGPAGWIGTLDAVLVAFGRGGGSLPVRDDLDDHARVRRARHHRRDVVVHGDDHGFVTLGRGLVGRRELSVELFDGAEQSAGHGRRLVGSALGLVPPGEAVWAQVAPGNAASLRVFLGCGFVPIGSEVLIEPDRADQGTGTSSAV